MKTGLKVIGIVVALLIVIAIALPILLKDQQLLDQQLSPYFAG